MWATRRQLSGVVVYFWPASWLPSDHVPEPEFGRETSVRLAGDAPDDQRLRVDRAPVGKARRRIDVGDLLDEGGGVDGREQAAALEIVGNDLRHPAREVGVAG